MVSKRPTATPQYEIVGSVRIVRPLSGRVRHRRPDRQERRVSLPHRRSRPRQQHADRLRAGQQAVHRAELDVAADHGHHVHGPLALSRRSRTRAISNTSPARSRSCPIRTVASPTAAISACPDPTATSSSSSRSAMRSSTASTTICSSARTCATPTSTTISPRSAPKAWSADRLVARTYNYVKANAKNLALDNQFQADFATGPLVHKVLAGFDYFDLRAYTDYRSRRHRPDRRLRSGLQHAAPPFASLPPFILRTDQQNQTGIYLQDQIKLDRWTLTLTGRQDRASTEFDSQAFYPLAGHYTRDDTATTGRVGLNYLFDFGLSPYANYSTSFTPNLGADLRGQLLQADHGRRRRSRRQVQACRLELHGHGGRLRHQAEGCSHPQPAQSALQRADRCRAGARLRARGEGQPDARVRDRRWLHRISIPRSRRASPVMPAST